MKFRTFFRVFLIAVLLTVIVACGENTTDSRSDSNTPQVTGFSVRLALPKALSDVTIPGLRAEAGLGDEAPIELTVNEDKTITGSLENKSPGTHDLHITYFVVLETIKIILASVTKEVVVMAGEDTHVTIVDTDFNRNYDEDDDGYTNLAEVKVGTSPRDPNDSPGGTKTSFYASNGSNAKTTSTNYSINQLLGSSLSGTSTSTNYTVTVSASNFK